MVGQAFSLPDFRDRLLADIDAHAAARTDDLALCGFDIEAVQVRHLDLGDLFDLLLGDLADLVLVRFRGTLGKIDGALDQTATGGVLVMNVKCGPRRS